MRWNKTVEQRFWEKVGLHDDPTKCWLWLAYSVKSDKLRYGRFWDGVGLVMAHRFSYEMYHHVTIPQGMTIDHVKARGCTSTLCVNPHHLEVVTSRVNTLRGDTIQANNAKKTYCVHGHLFNEKNTYAHNGIRQCRVCDREQYFAKKQKEVVHA